MSVDAGPYDLAPASGSGRAAALCLHGLTGTPYEVRPLAEALAARGIRARGPVLAGHDTTPEDLAKVAYQTWVDSAESELEKLRGEHERVFVAGLSMGGLLSLHLAAEGVVDAVAVVGVPLRLRPPLLMKMIPLAKRIYPMLPKKEGSDIQDPEARARHPGYKKMPLASVHELMRLQRRVAARLHHINAPILIAHGALDRTAHADDARAIAAGVASDDRRFMTLPRSGHVALVDYDGPHLAEAIADFFEEILPFG